MAGITARPSCLSNQWEKLFTIPLSLNFPNWGILHTLSTTTGLFPPEANILASLEEWSAWDDNCKNSISSKGMIYSWTWLCNSVWKHHISWHILVVEGAKVWYCSKYSVTVEGWSVMGAKDGRSHLYCQKIGIAPDYVCATCYSSPECELHNAVMDYPPEFDQNSISEIEIWNDHEVKIQQRGWSHRPLRTTALLFGSSLLTMKTDGPLKWLQAHAGWK